MNGLSNRPASSHRFASAVAGLCAACVMQAAEPATESSPTAVALPPMIVDGSDGPPWFYAEAFGCEILSRCSLETTAAIVESFGRARVAFDHTLPPLLRGGMEMPEMVLLYDKALWRRAGTDLVAAELARDAGASTTRMAFPANLRLADADTWATFILVEDQAIDARAAALTPEAVGQAIAARVPRLPDWFSAGFLAIYPRLEQGEGAVTLPPLRWRREVADPFIAKTRVGALPVPLAVMLRSGRAPSDMPVAIWLAQAELIVRWGLDIETREPGRFWRFVNDVAETRDPEHSAATFLGLSVTEAEGDLSRFFSRAGRSKIPVAALHASDVPKTRIREATPGEVARIRGEWERLEWRYVVRTAAEFAPAYESRARKTLGGAYDNGDRDPRLLASLGLLDLERGAVDQARMLLEAAVEAQVARPRPYYELAKLRYEERWSLSRRSDGRLDSEAIASVLEPLLAARHMQPRSAEVYRTVAQVWSNAAEAATFSDLTVLEEGLRLFPGDGDLAFQTAQVFEAAGQRRRAREIAERGAEESAGSDAERLRAKAEALRGE